MRCSQSMVLAAALICNLPTISLAQMSVDILLEETFKIGNTGYSYYDADAATKYSANDCRDLSEEMITAPSGISTPQTCAEATYVSHLGKDGKLETECFDKPLPRAVKPDFVLFSNVNTFTYTDHSGNAYDRIDNSRGYTPIKTDFGIVRGDTSTDIKVIIFKFKFESKYTGLPERDGAKNLWFTRNRTIALEVESFPVGAHLGNYTAVKSTRCPNLKYSGYFQYEGQKTVVATKTRLFQ